MIHVESVKFVPRKLLMYLIIIFLGEMFCFLCFFFFVCYETEHQRANVCI